jgi:hypothetical protein
LDCKIASTRDDAGDEWGYSEEAEYLQRLEKDRARHLPVTSHASDRSQKLSAKVGGSTVSPSRELHRARTP